MHRNEGKYETNCIYRIVRLAFCLFVLVRRIGANQFWRKVLPFPSLNELSLTDKEAVEKILQQLASKVSFGKVSDEGFVTRGGTTFQIPTINISLDPTHPKLVFPEIDYTAVGSDFVRVLLEAFFDGVHGIPAVDNATGVAISDQAAEHAGLPKFSSYEPRTPYERVTQDDFSNIDQVSNQTDAAASLITGEVLRGVGPVALNNEAIAKLIETFVGETVRKVTELSKWCWHASRQHEADGTALFHLSNGSSGPANPSAVTVTITY